MFISKEQLCEVIRLSGKSRRMHDIFMGRYFPSRSMPISEAFKYSETEEKIASDNADKELMDYLSTLKYNAILDLEALMDFGREVYHYNNSSVDGITYEKYFGLDDEDKNPADYFKERRKYFGKLYPKSDGKNAAIIYLTEKPLDDYLNAAANMMQIL